MFDVFIKKLINSSMFYKMFDVKKSFLLIKKNLNFKFKNMFLGVHQSILIDTQECLTNKRKLKINIL